MGRCARTLFGVCLVVLGICTYSTLAQTQQIVVFGDSLSDSGVQTVGGGYARWLQNTLRTTLVYPGYPYAQGRFSNGPVWSEYASQQLSVPLVSWAAAGATSGAGIVQGQTLSAEFLGTKQGVKVLAPNLGQQLDQFSLASNNTADPNDLYMVYIGHNDYLSIHDYGQNVTAAKVVDFIKTAFQILYDRGGRKFVVGKIAHLASLPQEYLHDADLAAEWMEHNNVLSQALDNFNSTHPGAALYTFDFGDILTEIGTSGYQIGIWNTTTACQPEPVAEAVATRSQPCPNPEVHLYWDWKNPTTTVHGIIGARFAQQFAPVFQSSVPARSAPLSSTSKSGK